jgi:hypothetical protein
MNTLKVQLYISVFLLFSASMFTSNSALFADEPSAEMSAETSATPAQISGELYLPVDDPTAAVEAAIERAGQNNKLALVIMGANWCHDSRGLASRFHQEPMKTLMDENYETIFVDVGYLNKGRELIADLGPPVYYATPTVLIIDPVSGQLVNQNNRHQWSDAFSINMEDTVAYFEQMAAVDLAPLRAESNVNADLQQLLNEIDRFEQAQADRLYQAYAILGPMLKEYKEGNEEAFSDSIWDQVRDFRYKVPYDVDDLRVQARDRVAAGESNIELNYPKYTAFSWENVAP